MNLFCQSSNNHFILMFIVVLYSLKALYQFSSPVVTWADGRLQLGEAERVKGQWEESRFSRISWDVFLPVSLIFILNATFLAHTPAH